MTPRELQLRQQLEHVLLKYDGGALPPGIAALVKRIQNDIAWEQHAHELRGWRDEA